MTLRPDRSLFNPVEHRLFRYTAVMFCMIALTAMAGLVLWSFAQVVSVFYNLIVSLSLAGILALVLYPVVDFLDHRTRLPRVFSVLLVLLVCSMAIGGLIYLVAPTLIRQVVALMTTLPEALARWGEHFSFYYPDLSSMISDRIESSGGEEAQPALAGAGTTIASYLGLLAGTSFVPLFLFFALLSGNLLRGKAIELLSIFHQPTQLKVLYFMDVFVGYVTAFFRGQLIIAMCMGGLYALSFSLIGLSFSVLAGLVLGLLNIVPFLGTLVGLMVILPMAYLQPEGGIDLLLMTLVAFALVQLVESWFLTPKIMADRSGLHPALVVVALFFWGTALSPIIGMILAVPLTAFFVAIWGEVKASLMHVLSRGEIRP